MTLSRKFGPVVVEASWNYKFKVLLSALWFNNVVASITLRKLEGSNPPKLKGKKESNYVRHLKEKKNNNNVVVILLVLLLYKSNLLQLQYFPL